MTSNLPSQNASSEVSQPPAKKPRKRSRLIASLVILLAGVGLAAFLWFKMCGHNSLFGDPVLKADAAQLKSTVITSHLEAPIVPDKSLLWCSTFQLVWNESCKAAGGDIHMQNEPADVAVLNKKVAQLSDVAPESCLVMSGMVQDGIVGKIQQQLKTQFQGAADPDLLNRIIPQLPPDGFLAYTYLFRELPFEYPFKRLKEPLTFGNKEMESFGIRNLSSSVKDVDTAMQVTVFDYKGKDDFVLAVQPKDHSERIILAKVQPGETLLQTIEQVRARCREIKDKWEPGSYIESGESIAIPVMNFDLLRSYDELCEHAITTPGPLQGMPITLAVQSIRFRLDERGAVLKSESGIYACAASMEPRQFIFDKPFLLLLERRNAQQPYFALWVGSQELLVPFH